MPVFLSFYLSPNPDGKHIAMLVLCLSFITDVLDGFIARQFNMISNLGKILDPLADKLMQITVLICIALTYTKLVWLIIMLLIKDVLIGVGAFILFKKKKRVSQSNWFGKVSCFLSVFCSLVLMFGNFHSLTSSICIGIIAIANIIAFVSYVFDYIKYIRE